jgi:hypothetical protein
VLNPDKVRGRMAERRLTQKDAAELAGYILKEGDKHAGRFFNAGYTQDNPFQLRCDMARQFDMEKRWMSKYWEPGPENSTCIWNSALQKAYV